MLLERRVSILTSSKRLPESQELALGLEETNLRENWVSIWWATEKIVRFGSFIRLRKLTHLGLYLSDLILLLKSGSHTLYPPIAI